MAARRVEPGSADGGGAGGRPPSRARVAVVGSGIAGLGAAHALMRRCGAALDLVLYEAGRHFGGHTHTVDVTLEGRRFGVDTGFLVYNERTYPRLIALLAELGVPVAKSDMSFSVMRRDTGLEWNGSNLNSVFAQRSNLLRPRFWHMLAQILRFNREATQLARGAAGSIPDVTVGAWLRERGYGAALRDDYLLPMIGCIWSCPTAQMLEFPLATLLRFCDNHGLLQVEGRPQWYTVQGGARHYVERIVAQLADARLGWPVTAVERLAGGGVAVHSARGGVEHYDAVLLACHSDQALALLGTGVNAAERAALGAIGYQPNQAWLHTDSSLLPRRRLAWAAWNYDFAGVGHERQAVCLHYLLNKLQPLPVATPLVVSLNPWREPAAETVLARIDYAHPVFDRAAIAAQARFAALQGEGGVHFAGAWLGYGFHEDGLASGQQAAERIAASLHARGLLPAAGVGA
jgi:predicted NAD/FAD-binding protein